MVYMVYCGLPHWGEGIGTEDFILISSPTTCLTLSILRTFKLEGWFTMQSTVSRLQAHSLPSQRPSQTSDWSVSSDRTAYRESPIPTTGTYTKSLGEVKVTIPKGLVIFLIFFRFVSMTACSKQEGPR